MGTIRQGEKKQKQYPECEGERSGRQWFSLANHSADWLMPCARECRPYSVDFSIKNAGAVASGSKWVPQDNLVTDASFRDRPDCWYLSLFVCHTSVILLT